MKKIFIIYIVLQLSVQIVFAKNDKDYSLHFDGNKYHLLYSVKNPDFGGYLNEYYKQGETYNIWSEMLAVHHFPNAYSPIDRIRDFKEYLSDMQIPSSLTFDDKKNTAMIDFIMITNNHMPVVLEFNIFKYEKSKKCGSIAVQYVKRYAATTTMQIEEIKKDFEKNRKHYIKKVRKISIPEVITKDIDKCISGIDVSTHDNTNKQTQEELSEHDTLENNVTEVETEDYVLSDNIKNLQLENNSCEQNIDESIDKNNENDIVKNSTSDDINENVDNNKLTQVNEEQQEEIIQTIENTQNEKQVKDVEKNVSKQDNTDILESKKQVKPTIYEIKNNKDDYIASPRSNKELKELVKQIKLEQKNKTKQIKINKKIEAKAYKKAKKLENRQYEISNNKDTYFSKPRTKKELKEYKKSMDKARKRAKRAKQKLDE